MIIWREITFLANKKMKLEKEILKGFVEILRKMLMRSIVYARSFKRLNRVLLNFDFNVIFI